MKECTNCNKLLPLDCFTKHKKHKDGLQYNCKDCITLYKKEYYKEKRKTIRDKQKLYHQKNKDIINARTNKYHKENREKSIEYKLIKNFSISSKDYNLLLEKQNFVCAICKNKEKNMNKNLAVDHCHTTGKIRGLLCRRCNTSLGAMEENYNYILNMIEYIKNSITTEE